jgi:hypothetical protein
MQDNELIELARAYVALSNAHRIDLILPMFATGARYVSTAVGEYRGQAAIGDMMHGFFASYPDVHWQARDFHCEDHQVSFKFIMTAGGAENEEDVERRGIERIEFTADGSIKKLSVEVS